MKRIPEPISNPELTDEFVAAWMKTKVVAVDVETDYTLIPLEHGSQSLHRKKDGSRKANTVAIGTSYAAPITDIALVAPNVDPVVFNMRGFTLYSETPDPYVLSVSIFIAELLSRPDITIVGHNVVFDLRQLGGHYDFDVHLESLVWGTQVMGIRLMIGEDKSKGAFGAGFSLRESSRHLGILKVGTDTFKFLDVMKKHVRSNIGDVLNAVEGSDNPKHFWDYLGGKPEDEDERIALAHRGVELYVLADAQLAFLLYKAQKNFAKKIAKRDVNITVQMVYPSGERPEMLHYPKYPNITEHVIIWQAQMRLAANWAIHGIPFDTEAALKRQSAAEIRFSDIMSDMPILLEEDLDPNFRITYDTLVWYNMILGVLRKYSNGAKIQGVVNYQPNGKVLPYWNHIEDIEENKLRIILERYLSAPANVKDFWIDLLVNIKPSKHYTNARLAKALGEINLPDTPENIDTVAYCNDSFYRIDEAFDPETAEWKAICRDRWLKYLHKQREELTSQDLWNKLAWKPYFIFTVSQMPLPFNEDFHQTFELATDTIKKKARAWTERTRSYGEPAPYRSLILEQGSGLSFNRDAMDFYIKEIERDEALDLDTEPFKLFKEVSEADGLITRINEYLAHSSVDGKIHSIVIPGTRTGRDKSSSPNIQNMKMAKSRDFGHKYTFAGLIIAISGAWLIELDYSNAENKTGAMIALDWLFALATEFGDFHTTMAMAYWPHLDWANMTAEVHAYWRKKGKIITFGTAYGMGAIKLAAKLKVTLEEARMILEEKDRAYPNVAKAKAITMSQIDRMAMGHLNLLPYIELWDGQRVAVPRYIKGGETFEVPSYKGWNFKQQGGVSVLIHRAAIVINRMLIEGGYRTHIAFNVHDSLILSMDIQEYFETNILQKIIQVMVDMMPKEMCERTLPHIEYVANADIPGNAEKWGYHETLKYPFPRNEFTDYWGHRVPLEAEDMVKAIESWEAPTRKAGPEWNFDPEAMYQHHLQQHKEQYPEQKESVVDNSAAIEAYHQSVLALEAVLKATGHARFEALCKTVIFKLPEGEIKTVGFVDHFMKSGILFAKGIEAPYEKMIKRILFILQETQDTDLNDWITTYEYLIPKSLRAISIELRRRQAASLEKQP